MRYLLFSLSLFLVGCGPAQHSISTSRPGSPSSTISFNDIKNNWYRSDGLSLEITAAHFIITEPNSTKTQLAYVSNTYTNNEIWLTQYIPPKNSYKTRFSWELSRTELFLTVAHQEDINDPMAMLAGRYMLKGSTKESKSPPEPKELTDAKEKFQLCQNQRKRIVVVSTQLTLDRAQLISKLRSRGLRIFDDLDRESVLLGHEIVEIDDHLTFLREKDKQLIAAGIEIESIVRRIQRYAALDDIKSMQQNIEQEIQKLSVIRIDLDEKFEPKQAVGDARATQAIYNALHNLVPVEPPK